MDRTLVTICTALFLVATIVHAAKTESTVCSSIRPDNSLSCPTQMNCTVYTHIIIKEVSFDYCVSEADSDSCCCEGQGDNDCSFDMNDQSPHMSKLVKKCTGNQTCSVDIPDSLPQCVSNSKRPRLLQISYTCVKEPLNICTSLTKYLDVKEDETFYLTYYRQGNSGDSVSCECSLNVVRDSGYIEVVWLLGSFKSQCRGQVIIVTEESRSTRGCDGNTDTDGDVNGLHKLSISGENMTVTISNLHSNGLADKVWLALKVSDNANVYVKCGDKTSTSTISPNTRDPVESPTRGNPKSRTDTHNDEGSGVARETITIIAVVVSVVVVLVIVAVALMVYFWRRKHQKTLEPTPAPTYMYPYPDSETQGSEYASISRQGSTYATINDFNMDSHGYSRISVKSNEHDEYNKSSLSGADISLDPNYNRLESVEPYSRLQNSPEKQTTLPSNDYNKTSPRKTDDGDDDYDHTTNKRMVAGGTLSTDYNHFKGKQNELRPDNDVDNRHGTPKSVTKVAVNNIGKQNNDIASAENRSLPALPNIHQLDDDTTSKRPDVALPFDQRQADVNQTGIALPTARNNVNDSDSNSDSDRENIESDTDSRVSVTDNIAHKNEVDKDYETSVPNKNYGYETAVVATDIDDNKTVSVKLGNEVNNKTDVISGPSDSGYETAVVNTDKDDNKTISVKLGSEVNNKTDVISGPSDSGYETAVVNTDKDDNKTISVKLGSEVNNKTDVISGPSDSGYETAVVNTDKDDNKTVKLGCEFNSIIDVGSGPSASGYETAVVATDKVDNKTVSVKL